MRPAGHLVLALGLAACGTSPAAGPDASTDAAADVGVPPDGSATDGGGTDGSPGADAGGIPTGGTVLFQENFDDGSFGGRGWYDSSGGAVVTTEHAPGSTSAFECAFALGATNCTGGTPARHKFAPSSSGYIGVWIKFSSNWVGSGKPYHPHMMHFVTNEDTDYVGPAGTHLTTYFEVLWVNGGGSPRVAIQDLSNVETSCVLKNDDSFVGCNGDFQTYPFTEDRSAASCNGLAGFLDERDCYSVNGNDTAPWYSARTWRASGGAPWFTETAGPRYKNDWHYMEAYYELNSIQNGVGAADGKIRIAVDGELLLSSDAILFRTGVHTTMQLDQFLLLPYIGDGSPIAQTFWLDDLTVATAKP
jgi:hypothetical protein